jgi:PAS domain S-box-containing protein
MKDVEVRVVCGAQKQQLTFGDLQAFFPLMWRARLLATDHALWGDGTSPMESSFSIKKVPALSGIGDGTMNGQLDYIFFTYGFAFLLLSAILWGRVQSARERLPWSWLAWFGLLHGMNEWLDMLAICLGDSTAFKVVRLAFLATSFVPLVEFGRCGLKAQGIDVPGRWALVPLLVMTGLGSLAGVNGLNAAFRYALGFPGGWLAGWVLVREARQLTSGKRWPHLLAGVAFLFYGLATGLIVPKATFFPAFALNQEAFIAACGFPVQLLRAMCAAMAALGLWLAYHHGSGTAYEIRLFRRWIMPGIVAILLTGGFWAVNWSGQVANTEQRDRLLHQAVALARTIGVEQVKTLSFTDADKANPAFQRLRGQMMAFARAVDARSLYSMAVRNGQIIFGPESLAENDPFASPPGTVYEKPPDVLHNVFRSRLPQTCGPYTDEYGSFVSAFAPVTDPHTGEVTLVIGVDLEARAWSAPIASERFHAILFTLTLAVISLVGSVQLERRRMLSEELGGWQSHVETWITAIVGLTLTLGLAHAVLEDEVRSRRTMFVQMAHARAEAVVRRTLDVQENIAVSLAHLLEIDQAVSRHVFGVVTGPYTNTRAIAGLGWAPRVAAGERGMLEEQGRLEGFENFAIHEQDTAGRKQPAEPREAYYPQFFVEPEDVSKSALGFDIAGDPERWTAAQEAMLSGMPTATNVVRSVSDPRQEEIDVYTPVFKKGFETLDEPARGAHGGLLGLVWVTLRLDALLKEAASELPPDNELAAMSLYQLETGRPPTLLTATLEDSAHIDAFAPAQGMELNDIVPLFAFGRAYAIVVHPRQAFLAARPLWSGWAIGLAGLLLTTALAAFVGSIAKHQTNLEKQVLARTAELLESRESYHRQFSDNSAVMLLIDPTTGRIIDANAAAATFYGHLREHLLTMHIMDIDTLHTESIPVAMKSVSAEGVQGLEAQHRMANGSVHDVEVSYSLILFQGQELLHAIIHDISGRKRAEEALQNSHSLLVATLESTADGILVVDTAGKVISFNRSYLELWRIPEALIATRDDDLLLQFVLDQLLYPDEFLGKVRVLYKTPDASSMDELIFKDGRIFERYSQPQRIDNTIVGRVWSFRDITKRKHAEEERRRLEERLQRAEKMEALGTLAGGVAHDLNNVLGIVVGYAELLLDDLGESSSERSQAMEIFKGGQRAAAIVRDLLTLARRGVPNRKVLSLNSIIMECQSSPEFAKVLSYYPGIVIKSDFDVEVLNITGSSVHLQKSFMNLLSNAAEAMPHGGTLTIKTRNQYLDKPVSGYDEVKEGDYVALSVTDTGEGIPSSDQKRIFEPFYTKKVMGRSGTGLGLAVVWGTIRDHHGYINVESEEGEGTTFTLYFPVTREEMTPEQVSISAATYMGNGQSILVVDDIKEQRELAVKMLNKLNYRVATVSSGEEAVEYLKQRAVDLIVLDMIMDPGMDGLDTYTKILEIHPLQKAIIVSGFSETERVSKAQALGAGAYVRKPYVLEKLGLAVRKEIDEPHDRAR